jgi:hypothetical protein
LKMTGKKGTGLLCAAVAFAGIAGCAHFRAEVPQGFAEYEGRSVYKAVSPDGVVFRVRSVKNDPYAELSFWQEALTTRMRDAGYSMVDSGRITVADRPASIIELAAPLGSEDQSYLIAVIYGEKRLVIVEAAGEVVKFKKHKEEIIEAIKKIIPD